MPFSAARESHITAHVPSAWRVSLSVLELLPPLVETNWTHEGGARLALDYVDQAALQQVPREHR